MEEKVDLRKLGDVGSYPSLYEKLTRELAEEIQMEEDKDYIVVSWEVQEKAMNYFNQHGFEKTLSYMLELRKKNND